MRLDADRVSLSGIQAAADLAARFSHGNYFNQPIDTG